MDPVTNYCESILGENLEAKSAIRLIPEFRDCSDQLLTMVYRYSKTVDIKPGESLITEGLFDQWVYFIIEGDLVVRVDGRELGTTAGPIVGERCILGEPRGADLFAGESGLLALGVEMTIIDELFRQVNDFSRTSKDEAEVETYSNKQMSIALELLSIVLQEVISRIVNLHGSSLELFKQVKESEDVEDIQLQSLFDFTASDTSADKDKKSQAQKIAIYSFDDYAEIVYFELLHKHLSEHGFTGVDQAEWKNVFKLEASSKIDLAPMYQWLEKSFQISKTQLIDVTYSIFDVASQYTAASNKALNAIISFMSNKSPVKMDPVDPSTEAKKQESVLIMIEQLFNPIREKLQNQDTESEATKMSQADIDSFFD